MSDGIIAITESVNKVKVRLTFERWYHISEGHPELAGAAYDVLDAINNPDLLVAGFGSEYLALCKINSKYLVAVYKEINQKDGFVITAFYTSDINSIIKKRKILWKKPQNK